MFIIGQIFDFMDLDGADLDGDMPGSAVSPIKPSIIAVFITTFGGAGMYCNSKGWMALMVALAVAFMVSYLFYKGIIVPLYRSQNTNAVSQESLIGHPAKATLNIDNDSFGSIRYIINGSFYTAPAKSIDKIDIEKGDDVVIIDSQLTPTCRSRGLEKKFFEALVD